jgi:hypothetical protein
MRLASSVQAKARSSSLSELRLQLNGSEAVVIAVTAGIRAYRPAEYESSRRHYWIAIRFVEIGTKSREQFGALALVLVPFPSNAA